MGGTPTYEYRDGQRLAPAVAYDLDRMAAAFLAETSESLHVSEGGGLRTRAEQQEKYDAYLAYLNGGPWAPLAAHPDDPMAYHVESNPNGARAVDLYDSGAVGGVGTGTGPRHQWMLANAHRFNFENEGLTFSRPEPWHKKWTGSDPWAVPAPASIPAVPNPESEEDDDMIQFVEVPGKAGSRKGGVFAIYRNEKGQHRAAFIGTNKEARIARDGHLILGSQAAADRLEKITPGLR